jgi:hypothetical protein
MPRIPRKLIRAPLAVLLSVAFLIAAAASAQAAGRTVLLLLLNETSGKVAVDSSGLATTARSARASPSANQVPR